MDLASGHLLEGETVLLEKAANAVLHPSDYGLSKIPVGSVGLALMGWRDMEAIGGKLHVTNYRLLFSSHAINRVTGTISIFLPTITQLRDVSRMLSKKLAVTTPSSESTFVVWGIPQLIAVIEQAKAAMTPDVAEAAARHAMAWVDPSAAMKVSKRVDLAVKGAALMLKRANDLQNPADALTFLNMLDLLNDLRELRA